MINETFKCVDCGSEIVIDPDMGDEDKVICDACLVDNGKLCDLRVQAMRQATSKAVSAASDAVLKIRQWWGS